MKYPLFFAWAIIVFAVVVVLFPDALKLTPMGPALFAELLVKTDDYVHIYVDRETGCQYVRVGWSITPRLRRDGKPMCGLSK